MYTHAHPHKIIPIQGSTFPAHSRQAWVGTDKTFMARPRTMPFTKLFIWVWIFATCQRQHTVGSVGPGHQCSSRPQLGRRAISTTAYGGVHGHTPIAGWFIVENPICKWMMTGGTRISGNPHIWGLKLKAFPTVACKNGRLSRIVPRIPVWLNCTWSVEYIRVPRN